MPLPAQARVPPFVRRSMDTESATVARHDRGELAHRRGRDALARLRDTVTAMPSSNGRSDSPPASILPRFRQASRNVSETASVADQSAVSRKPRLQTARAYSSKSTPVGRGNCARRSRSANALMTWRRHPRRTSCHRRPGWVFLLPARLERRRVREIDTRSSACAGACVSLACMCPLDNPGAVCGPKLVGGAAARGRRAYENRVCD